MLLLKFPQLSVDIKCPSKVGLPLLVSILRKIPVEESTLKTSGEEKIETVTCQHFGYASSSITSGCFPSKWKLARVTPVLKSRAVDQAHTFRPISILPLFSKVLKRV